MMWPYWVMVGTPALLSLLGDAFFNKKTRNRMVVISFFAIWFLLLCLRSERVGIDTINYHRMFIEASHMSFGEIFSRLLDSQFEAGYYVISKAISVFTSDYRVVMIVVAGVSLFPIFWLYMKYADESPYLSIILLLSLGMFSIYFSAFRQVLAIAFAVPAFQFTKNRKLIKFLLIVLLAYVTHHSAFVLLLLYPIYHMELKLNAHVFFIVPIIGLVYVFRTQVFTALNNFLGDVYSGVIKETGAILIFLLLLSLLIFSFVLPENDMMDKENIGLRNLLFLSTILQIFAGINSVAMRLNYYYLIFIPLLIPRVINNVSEKNRKPAYFSYLIMVGFFTFWYFYRAYTTADILRVYPYYPMWSI